MSNIPETSQFPKAGCFYVVAWAGDSAYEISFRVWGDAHGCPCGVGQVTLSAQGTTPKQLKFNVSSCSNYSYDDWVSRGRPPGYTYESFVSCDYSLGDIDAGMITIITSMRKVSDVLNVQINYDLNCNCSDRYYLAVRRLSDGARYPSQASELPVILSQGINQSATISINCNQFQ